MLLTLLSGLLFYNRCSKQVEKYVSPVFKGNTMSSIHAVSAVIFSGFWIKTQWDIFVTFFILNTGGYYLYDLLSIGKKLKKKCDIMNILYVYHHIITILVMKSNPYNLRWMELIFYSEISNIQTKYAYKKTKKQKIQKKHNRKTQIAKLFQFLHYIYVRIYKIPEITYHEMMKKTFPFFVKLSLPMIPLGIIWTMFIFKKIRFNVLFNTGK